MEIAANYSQAFVTFMALLLGRLWNHLYDGVEFEHVDKLSEIGDGAEIIYVPCHRSHMDYLLLSYVIYRKGFAVPHIAAGANLNMPVIGHFLRKGGAFFMRRSFKGDALYAAVFTKYLGFMMARGHPLEYFIEGGRSRTGRLLAPRTGMLSMTVRSYVRDPKRPVVFMPVYFGYERIVEGRTYLGELSGQPKQKESIVGLLRSLSILRSKFGKVHVNLGQPIVLDELLQKHNPHWRSATSEDEESPPDWIGALVAELAVSITAGVNAAAAVTPINLVAMAVLATPRQALLEADLMRQVELYQRLLHDAPYAPLVTVTADSGAQMIRYAESMGMLDRQPHPLGEIMRMSADRAVLATYYRNNILHLFAMPSLLACCFVSNARMRTVDIQRLVWRVYPYICAELALRWPEAEVSAVADSLLDAFARLNLLEGQRGPQRMAAPGADLARGRRAVTARGSDHSDDRALLPGDRAAAAGGFGKHRSRGARAALPPDGPAHVASLRPAFSRVLRQKPVPQLHRAAVPPRRRPGIERRHAQVRGAAVGRRHRCAIGPVRADQARHPAGDARAVRRRRSLIPSRFGLFAAWCWRGASSIRCAAPWTRAWAAFSCGSWARSAPLG